ncbi:MAG: hypothetical protein K1Y36_06585 [Blastocatellia bacterium]|nr:hypothetical protein [Blastocatellia bacterium]
MFPLLWRSPPGTRTLPLAGVGYLLVVVSDCFRLPSASVPTNCPFKQFRFPLTPVTDLESHVSRWGT